jgi:hypothetical protein
MRGAIPPLPNTPSWRDAHLRHRDNFTFYLYERKERKGGESEGGRKKTERDERNDGISCLLAKLITISALILHRLQHLEMEISFNKR